MRLDVVIDSAYVLGSLWGTLTGLQLCPANLRELPGAGYEIALLPVRRAGAPVTAFVHVNVVPMDRERVLANQTVLVEGDRILALGPSREIKVPTGAPQIDGRGKYLIPGLADMHVHNHPRSIAGRTDDEIDTRLIPFIAEGITTIRSWSGGAEWERQAELLSRPHVYTPGALADPAAAKAAGHHYVYLHNFPQSPGDPGADTRLLAAHHAGLAVAAHDHGSSFDKALSLGRVGGSIEHLAWLRDTLIGFSWQQFGPIGQREADAAVAKIPTLTAAVARSGLWVTPTLHCIVHSYNTPPLHTMIVRRAVKALQEAGVGLLLAGDDGYSVQDELAALVDAGLTPYQALVTGTRNVAQYFGLLDSSGTVAVGKRADLVLLDGNPLQDIRYTREPAGVLLHGRWLDRAELDRRLLAYSNGNEFPSWFWLGMTAGYIVRGREHPPADTSSAAFAAWGERRTERFLQLKAHMAIFESLGDSLAAAISAGAKAAAVSQRLRHRMADELAAMRAIIPPKRRVAFDPVARLWLREQTRQGFPITVSGVNPSP